MPRFFASIGKGSVKKRVPEDGETDRPAHDQDHPLGSWRDFRLRESFSAGPRQPIIFVAILDFKPPAFFKNSIIKSANRQS